MIIHKLSAAKFRPYGRLIYYPNQHNKGKKRNLWRIILSDPSVKGWRIAYLVLRDKRIHRLGQHPNSHESFEPVKGKALMFVAKRKDEEAIECFLLDRPIILYKGIWHNVITLGTECEIKITENADVKSLDWKLSYKTCQKLNQRR